MSCRPRLIKSQDAQSSELELVSLELQVVELD